MTDQELLHHLVSARGVVVQVDTVPRVWLDVGFKRLRGRERFGYFTWDRSVYQCRVTGGGAVATAEDEVLVCDRLEEERPARRSGTHRR